MRKLTYSSSARGSRPVHTWVAVAFGLFMLGSWGAGWAAVRAELDRGTAQVGDTLTLSIISDAAPSGAQPNLSALRKDFDVLGSSTSSETTIVNGKRSDTMRWQVSLLVRHAGSIAIAPIPLGGEYTAALKLDVTQGSSQAPSQGSRHAFMEVAVADAGKPVYVQQQIAYTVRLFVDDTLQGGELGAPGSPDAIIEQLGADQRYTTTRDGRTYNVIERHYAIAPEKSGALRIGPATFRGTAAAPGRTEPADSSNGLLGRLLQGSPFLNDPVFKDMLAGGVGLTAAVQPIAASSQELTIKVQPRPPGAQGPWLPAQQIILHDSWADQPPQFRVGEPVTRTITIDATGLAASQIPPLALAQPDNARTYPEPADNQSRTDGDVIHGISRRSVTYIPSAQGTIEIAPVELAWWNTRSNAQSRASLPALKFTVGAGAAPAQSNAAPPSGVVPGATSAAAPARDESTPQNSWLSKRLLQAPTWPIIGAALLAAVILWFVAIRRPRRPGAKSPPAAAPAPTVPHYRTSLRALHRACRANEQLAAAHALLDLARAKWPEDAPRGLSALAARVEAGADEIRALDRSLYGAGESRWEGAALWDAIRRGLKPKRIEHLPDDDGLGSIYL